MLVEEEHNGFRFGWFLVECTVAARRAGARRCIVRNRFDFRWHSFFGKATSNTRWAAVRKRREEHIEREMNEEKK